MRLWLFALVACGSAPPAARREPVVQRCASHRVHGQIRDATSGEPVSHVRVGLTGGDGEDDASTDDDGRFDLRATKPTRDHLVVIYGDGNMTTRLSSTRCDEELNLRVGLGTSSPMVM